MFDTHFVQQLPPYPFDPAPLEANKRLKMNGADLLKALPEDEIACVFFDPQYRGVLDAMSYGNEGARQKERSQLTQMDDAIIGGFCDLIDIVLRPSGYLFLWLDKFHLVEGMDWIKGTDLKPVDLITWHKGGLGMGYRTRRACEYLLILQSAPKRIHTWTKRNIPDVWTEQIKYKTHPHQKPQMLQMDLIEAVTEMGDFIVDPAAGSFSVMYAAHAKNRNFIGCDLEG